MTGAALDWACDSFEGMPESGLGWPVANWDRMTRGGIAKGGEAVPCSAELAIPLAITLLTALPQERKEEGPPGNSPRRPIVGKAFGGTPTATHRLTLENRRHV